MTKYLVLKLTLLLFLHWNFAEAQEKYWVDNELAEVANLVLPEPLVCSEWLGCCSYLLNEKQIEQLSKKGTSLLPVLQFETLATEESSTFLSDTILGFALEQIKAEHFLKLGLNGKGVKIGIIDGGFLNANNSQSLAHLFGNGLVKSYKDYITPDMKEYGGAHGLDDGHGTEVWQQIGGFNPEKKILNGLATASEYYLARTDHGAYEKRIEEDYMIQAMEEMERLGVKLINISLGYNTGYKEKSENYKPSQMDGKTSKIAQAVDYAAVEKGMLIVVAAGNDGRTKWKIIDTPADAKYALTVGSSKFKIFDKMNFSSIGPDFTDFVKPDVSVYSTMGTSFSTPVITGMAACIWQMNPELTNLEIIDIFKKAGNFYPYPNNYLGYGVPTAPSILRVIRGDSSLVIREIHTSRKVAKIKNENMIKYVVAFHKKDERNVLGRVVYRPKKSAVKVKKLDKAIQTSVLIGSEVVEIFWEE